MMMMMMMMMMMIFCDDDCGDNTFLTRFLLGFVGVLLFFDFRSVGLTVVTGDCNGTDSNRDNNYDVILVILMMTAVPDIMVSSASVHSY